MSEEYQAVLSKVVAFTAGVEARRAEAFACARGCSACCEVFLTVSPVEAAALRGALAQLDAAARAALGARAAAELAREAAGRTGARCALLDEHGACVAYAGRPLVCRTQGHALLYPAGVIPAQAIRRREPKGEVTHCPLNYTGAPPAAADTLDAGLVDKLLAVVNHRFAAGAGVDAGERVAIARIAAEAAVLASPLVDDADG
jgi:Putative zinc- or iron-chelating domain